MLMAAVVVLVVVVDVAVKTPSLSYLPVSYSGLLLKYGNTVYENVVVVM